MYYTNSKRRTTGRISVWVLVFALMLTFMCSVMMLPASAENMAGGMGDAAADMGNAIGDAAGDMGDGMAEAADDIGNGVGEAVNDLGSSANDGRVNDSDGIIGNSRDGADKDMTSGNSAENAEPSDTKKAGWIALAIAIVVIIAVVVLVIVFIPKKKENN